MANEPQIICVDLDGTLCKVDTLIVGLLELTWRRPWRLLPLLLKVGDRSTFKHYVATHAGLREDRLPYHQELLDLLSILKQEGAKIYLVTGASQITADKVMNYIGIFEGYHASHNVNLTGANKARLLEDQFGHGGFLYAGDSLIDLKVWQTAERAIVVGSEQLKNQAASYCEVLYHYAKDSKIMTVRHYLRYFFG